METAETGERAFLGAEVLHGCADFGSDGFLFNEEEVGFNELCLLGLLVLGNERGVDFVGVGKLGFEGCGGGSFDHGESGYDIAVGVGNLTREC